MAKVSDDGRAQYKEAIVPYQKQVEALLAKEKALTNAMRNDQIGQAYKKVQLAEDMMDCASYYMAQNALSVRIINVKNNDVLNDARKAIYKAVIYLENVVTDYIDVSFAELAENLEEISNIPVSKRYALVTKLGLSINMLKDAFGDNSKWKWSFVELDGRFATVAKNFIDMKKAVKEYFDPNSDNYETTVLYIRLVGRLIDASASSYRDKYELSSRRLDDMRNAIKYLLARHKIFIAIGDRNGAEDVKKKAIVWHNKMEADQKSGSYS